MKLFKKSTPLFYIPLLLVMLFVQSCGEGPSSYYDVELTPPEPYDISKAVSDSTTEDGLQIYVIEEGQGRPEEKVVPRDQVQIRYTGRTADGKAFDSSYKNNTVTMTTFRNLTPVPVTFSGQRVSPLIDGFRRGIIGMKPGEKRKLIIPPELGYGDPDQNFNAGNLADKTLYFDVELVSILE